MLSKTWSQSISEVSLVRFFSKKEQERIEKIKTKLKKYDIIKIMKRILIKLQYDGTNYKGFQIQGNSSDTIQGEIEKALKKLFKKEVSIFGCSRTDSGVSAYEYYAHFDIETKIEPQKISYAINSFLPEDIRVLESKQVKDDFNARYNVKNKTYVYSLYASEHIMPLIDRYSVRLKKFPNTVLMQKASKKLIGTYDFGGFRSSDPSRENQNTVRKINSIKFQVIDNMLNIYINGDGFLYNMVRIIVGTLIEIGEGKKSIEVIDDILKTRDRSLAGVTMPAKGLRLYEVKY